MPQVPEELRWAYDMVANAVAYLFGGEAWPDCDSEAAYATAADHAAKARLIREVVLSRGRAQCHALAPVFQGADGDAAEAHWRNVLQPRIEGLATRNDELAEHHRKLGLTTEHREYLIIANVFAFALTFFIPLPGARIVASSSALITCAHLVRFILSLGVSAGLGSGVAAGTEFITQSIEIWEGHRRYYDWNAINTARDVGALSGGAGGVVGHVLSPFTRSAIRAGRKVVAHGVNAGAQAAGGASGAMAQAVYTGQNPLDPTALTTGALSGAMGAIGARMTPHISSGELVTSEPPATSSSGESNHTTRGLADDAAPDQRDATSPPGEPGPTESTSETLNETRASENSEAPSSPDHTAHDTGSTVDADTPAPVAPKPNPGVHESGSSAGRPHQPADDSSRPPERPTSALASDGRASQATQEKLSTLTPSSHTRTDSTGDQLSPIQEVLTGEQRPTDQDHHRGNHELPGSAALGPERASNGESHSARPHTPGTEDTVSKPSSTSTPHATVRQHSTSHAELGLPTPETAPPPREATTRTDSLPSHTLGARTPDRLASTPEAAKTGPPKTTENTQPDNPRLGRGFDQPRAQLEAFRQEAQQVIDPLGDGHVRVGFADIHPEAARDITDAIWAVAKHDPAMVASWKHITVTEFTGKYREMHGYATLRGEARGITLNKESFTDPAQWTKTATDDEAGGHTVPGGGDPKGIFIHEVGHFYADIVLNDPNRVAELNRVISHHTGQTYDVAEPTTWQSDALRNQLSAEGASSPHQLIAEAIAETWNSLSPRPLATAITDLLPRLADTPETPTSGGTHYEHDNRPLIHARNRFDPADGEQPGGTPRPQATDESHPLVIQSNRLLKAYDDAFEPIRAEPTASREEIKYWKEKRADINKFIDEQQLGKRDLDNRLRNWERFRDLFAPGDQRRIDWTMYVAAHLKIDLHELNVSGKTNKLTNPDEPYTGERHDPEITDPRSAGRPLAPGAETTFTHRDALPSDPDNTGQPHQTSDEQTPGSKHDYSDDQPYQTDDRNGENQYADDFNTRHSTNDPGTQHSTEDTGHDSTPATWAEIADELSADINRYKWDYFDELIEKHNLNDLENWYQVRDLISDPDKRNSVAIALSWKFGIHSEDLFHGISNPFLKDPSTLSPQAREIASMLDDPDTKDSRYRVLPTHEAYLLFQKHGLGFPDRWDRLASQLSNRHAQNVRGVVTGLSIPYGQPAKTQPPAKTDSSVGSNQSRHSQTGETTGGADKRSWSTLWKTTPEKELPILSRTTNDSKGESDLQSEYIAERHPKLLKTNPGFWLPDAKEKGYRHNCMLSSLTYLQQLRGITDAQAPPVSEDGMKRDGKLIDLEREILGFWRPLAPTWQEHSNFDNLVESVRQQPVGSYAAISMSRLTDDGARRIGHVVIATNTGEGVEMLDPQRGSLARLWKNNPMLFMLPFEKPDGDE